MAMATQRSVHLSNTKALTAGILAGLGGGLAFGAMMAMQGMLPMVAMLTGSDNALIGFGVHMFISAAIGAIYGLVAARLPQSYGAGIIAGAVNGVVWWVFGALVMMPMLLGMSEMIFQVGPMQWMSLVGHLIFGVIAGVLFIPLAQR